MSKNKKDIKKMVKLAKKLAHLSEDELLIKIGKFVTHKRKGK